MLEWITDADQLRTVQDKHDYFVLAFWGGFSDAAQRALEEVKQFAHEHKDVPVFAVDVQSAKGVHQALHVKSVPTVLAVEKGKVTKSVEGVESARFYALYFAGATPSRPIGSGGSRVRHVVVYSGPGCPACGQLKNYLRQQGVSYRDVDISRDPHAADRLARRSGMTAVPQIDISGQLVVGFDRGRIDRLLGITKEEERA